MDHNFNLFRRSLVRIAKFIITGETEFINAADLNLNGRRYYSRAVAPGRMAPGQMAPAGCQHTKGVAERMMTPGGVAPAENTGTIGEKLIDFIIERIDPIDIAGTAIAVQASVIAQLMAHWDCEFYCYN